MEKNRGAIPIQTQVPGLLLDIVFSKKCSNECSANDFCPNSQVYNHVILAS